MLICTQRDLPPCRGPAHCFPSPVPAAGFCFLQSNLEVESHVESSERTQKLAPCAMALLAGTGQHFCFVLPKEEEGWDGTGQDRMNRIAGGKVKECTSCHLISPMKKNQHLAPSGAVGGLLDIGLAKLEEVKKRPKDGFSKGRAITESPVCTNHWLGVWGTWDSCCSWGGSTAPTLMGFLRQTVHFCCSSSVPAPGADVVTSSLCPSGSLW